MAKPSNMGLEIMSLSSYTAPTTVEHVNKDFVYYGEDNDYFDELISHYNGSTTNGSIINGIASLIYGQGLGAKDANLKPMQWARLHSILKKRELKKVILDRKMLGMAAMQITYDKGQIKSITHFPMNNLRAEKANSRGEIVQWYYHRDWANIKTGDEPTPIKAFGYGNKKGNEIYVIKPYVTGSFYYPAPDYVQALPYAKLEEEIGDFLINDTINGFSGSMMVNFNNGIPTPIIQREMKQKVIANLTGATGQKVMVNFNKNGETATTMERFALDNAPDHYAYLADECRNKLIVGHRITSPLLIGVREAGSGFGSNADEIKTASTLMDNVLIKTFQNEFVDALDEILTSDNISLELFFKTSQPLEFSDETVEEKIEEPIEEVKEEVEELSVEEVEIPKGPIASLITKLGALLSPSKNKDEQEAIEEIEDVLEEVIEEKLNEK